MNTLILGAIFLVALLAIVGIIWLAMGERQGSGKAAAVPATNGNEQARKQASAPSTTPMVGKAERGTATAKGAPSMPAQREEMVAVPSNEQAFLALDGQFYELAAQLRDLHREVQDIERRLNALTAMVNRIEKEYGEVSLEAE
jgi:hypothetical protein